MESDQHKPGSPPGRFETPVVGTTASPQVGRAWAWPVALVLIFAILTLGTIALVKSCARMPVDTVDKIGSNLAKVVAAFNQGTIHTIFTSYAASLSGNQYLQVATLSQFEQFSRKHESVTGFGYIPLPEVVVEARAPVEYTYYLDLKDRWDFKIQDGQLLVIAPDLKFNKPAIDASKITYSVTKDSWFRNSKEATEILKDSLTALSEVRAKENIPLVRDTARRQTEQFVQGWLASSFGNGKYPARVVFRSELKSGQIDLNLRKKE